jgi:hypothetical protein
MDRWWSSLIGVASGIGSLAGWAGGYAFGVYAQRSLANVGALCTMQKVNQTFANATCVYGQMSAGGYDAGALLVYLTEPLATSVLGGFLAERFGRREVSHFRFIASAACSVVGFFALPAFVIWGQRSAQVFAHSCSEKIMNTTVCRSLQAEVTASNALSILFWTIVPPIWTYCGYQAKKSRDII